MVRVGSAVLIALSLLSASAEADELYRVGGSDRLRIGSSEIASALSYNGTERLRITRPGGSAQEYRVFAKCRASDGVRERPMTAAADVVIESDGAQRTVSLDDPAYLTIVTQPFAVALDSKTLAEVDALTRPEPFAFSSPMTGADLRGLLRRVPSSDLASGTTGIDFTADGPIEGALPGQPDLGLSGTMHMEGRAVYRRSDNLLITLDDTLTISGQVGEGARATAIRVVYQRSIDRMPTVTATPLPSATPKALGR